MHETGSGPCVPPHLIKPDGVLLEERLEYPEEEEVELTTYETSVIIPEKEEEVIDEDPVAMEFELPPETVIQPYVFTCSSAVLCINI